MDTYRSQGQAEALHTYGLQKLAVFPLAALAAQGALAAGRAALPHLARGAMRFFGGKLNAGLGVASGLMQYNEARKSGHGVLGSMARGAAGGLSFGAGKIGMGAQAANMALGAMPPPGGVPPPEAPQPGSMV